MPANQSLVILHIRGPGYDASGWSGETLYKTTEVTSAERYARKEIPIAARMEVQWGKNKVDKIVGGITKRDADTGMLRGSRRLNIIWHPLNKVQTMRKRAKKVHTTPERATRVKAA